MQDHSSYHQGFQVMVGWPFCRNALQEFLALNGRLSYITWNAPFSWQSVTLVTYSKSSGWISTPNHTSHSLLFLFPNSRARLTKLYCSLRPSCMTFPPYSLVLSEILVAQIDLVFLEKPFHLSSCLSASFMYVLSLSPQCPSVTASPRSRNPSGEDGIGLWDCEGEKVGRGTWPAMHAIVWPFSRQCLFVDILPLWLKAPQVLRAKQEDRGRGKRDLCVPSLATQGWRAFHWRVSQIWLKNGEPFLLPPQNRKRLQIFLFVLGTAGGSYMNLIKHLPGCRHFKFYF